MAWSSGSGGIGTGWYGEVANYASLPAATSSGMIYLVLNSTGFLWNRRKGLYRDEGTWNRLSNATFEVLDTEATFSDNVDNTKKMDFELSGITTGTTRTLIIPDEDGTILLEETGFKLDQTTPQTVIGIPEFDGLELPDTTFANQKGIITKNDVIFLHNFNYGDNGTVTTVGKNTFVGCNVGNLTMGATATTTSHGSFNSFFGCDTGTQNTIGYSNVFVGYNAGNLNTTGYSNVFVGQNSGYSNTTGFFNVGCGINTLRYNQVGLYNCAFGIGALQNTIGNGNVGIGFSTLSSNTTGTSNIGIGFNTLVNNISGASNIGIGGNALLANTSGTLNTVIGPNAFRSNVSGDSNVALGSSAGRYETGSNTFYVDNQDRTNTAGDKAKALLYGTFSATTPNQELNVNANLNIKENAVVGTGIKHDGLKITKSAEIQTTDATQTILDSITLIDENTYHIKVFVVGVQSDGSNRASYEMSVTAYRTGAGNAAIQGSVTLLHVEESNGAWNATFTVSGNDVQVSVTGVAATTIEWGCTLQYINMSN